MKLRKVHVKNYKCVEDSGEFSIDAVTCLVGKNESGKTAILEALYRLNPYDSQASNFDKVAEFPRRYLSDFDERFPKGDAEVVSTVWELEEPELKKLKEEFGEKCLKSNLVRISKGYKNVQLWGIEYDEHAIVTFLVEKYLNSNEQKTAEKKITLKELQQYLTEKTERSEKQEELLKEVNDKLKHEALFGKFLISRLEDGLPKFLLFSNYDEMSGNVQLEDLANRIKNNKLDDSQKVFVAFLTLAGIKAEEIQKIDKYEQLTAKLEAASNKISREIFEYWTQNRHLKVQVNLVDGKSGDPAPFNEGHIVRIRVYNEHHQVTVNFDARSSGFVWFFSFLALFSQVKKQYGNIMILLDEPGLRLHGKAQYDLLRYIKEKLEPDHQILYTTHSPFMVDPENLLRARTVEDVVIEKNGSVQVLGTKVGDKILSSDKDTLFPLQGALGYEITQSLFIGKNTLLVEGPSDLIYLKCLQDELKKRGREALSPAWTICPAGGIDKVMPFMTLFNGNKLNVAVLADYAQGVKGKIEQLRRLKLLEASRILTVNTYAGQDEADIEDIIGRDTYIALVNKTYNLTGKSAIPTIRSAVAPGRVVEEVAAHFRTLTPSDPEFDHFAPASYLLENKSAVLKTFPEETLNRFEKLFTDLNKFVPTSSTTTVAVPVTNVI